MVLCNFQLGKLKHAEKDAGYKILFKKRNVNIRGSLRPGIVILHIPGNFKERGTKAVPPSLQVN